MILLPTSGLPSPHFLTRCSAMLDVPMVPRFVELWGNDLVIDVVFNEG